MHLTAYTALLAAGVDVGMVRQSLANASCKTRKIERI